MLTLSNLKRIFLIFIIIISLTSTGCWDRRELDRLAIATCVGIDQGKEPNKVEMTVEIILPQNVKTPGGGGGTGNPSQNLVAQGKTAFDATRNFTLESDKKIYFAHNPVLIFSDEMAKKGVFGAFDFFVRDSEHRRTAWVLVSEGKAQDLINVKTILDPITGRYIEKLIEETHPISKIATVNIQNFLEKLMSSTTAPYCSLIKIKGSEKRSMELLGTAIFKKDKMVGKFDLNESRGLLWVLGEVKSGIITIIHENSQIALEITRAGGKFTPAIVDNTLKVIIEINEEGNIGEQECTVDLTTPEIWSHLEEKQAQAIMQEILAAVKKAQELNTDVFGFGEAFHRKYPTLWREQLEKNWDEFFPDLEVEVLVKAKLRKMGMITKPAISK